jgi:hypothetical protein
VIGFLFFVIGFPNNCKPVRIGPRESFLGFWSLSRAQPHVVLLFFRDKGQSFQAQKSSGKSELLKK